MADEQRWTDTLEKFFVSFARDINTIKPGVIQSVSGTTANIKILSKTRSYSGVQTEFMDVYNVPIFCLQAQRGQSYISMPVMPGDNVIVLFSDRNTGNLRNTAGVSAVDSDDVKTHTYEPLMAIPWLFTFPNTIPPNTGNITISNSGSRIDMLPDGTINVFGNINLTGNLAVNGIDFLTHIHNTPAGPSDPPQSP